MGYIAHDVVVLVTCTDEDIAAVVAWRDALEEEFRPFILGPVTGTNGYTTFVFAPDGSKEGWKTSDDFDAIRAGFLGLIDTLKWPDALHVRFGGDHQHDYGAPTILHPKPPVLP